MRKQIKFTFQIGYSLSNKEFEHEVICAASTLCGGCTTTAKNGWWMSDGATHSETFTGDLEGEHCFQLELTCEPRKADRVYHAMCRAIAAAAEKHGIPADWVHVTEVEMTGRHFSIASINGANAA